MIERHIRHDTIEPGIEAALETEAVQVFVHPQESFLINVAGIFGAMHEVERQAQDLAVVPSHQFLECQAITGLRIANQPVLFDNLGRRC